MKKINYSTKEYPFSEIIGKILNTSELSKIHLEEHFEKYDVFKREEDQSTKYHKAYYDAFHTELIELYDKFILNVIRPLYDEKIVYQKIPTFRLHFPGNIAVGEYHKDKWYRDAKWHSEVSELKYGDCIEWDGVNLTHGNKKNITNSTRISVDFRVMKESKYKPSDHGSINTKIKFELGGYYRITEK